MNEMTTINMKCTWPTPTPRIGDLTQPLFHLLALGVGVGGNANFRVGVGGNANFRVGVGYTRIFRHQHVGIPCWGSKPTRGRNANGFASQWTISFIGTSKMMSV